MKYQKKDFIQVSGELFTQVQLSGIFPDSKTFVDSIPKNDPSLILDRYDYEKKKPSFDLKKFILNFFELPEEKKVVIDLPEKRSMREHINLLWQLLKRDTLSNVNKFSTLIPIPKPYIVPGGRFREIYYWDSYFTIHGLLADGEVEIVENMIDNFAFLIDEIGFIPNGNRVYYLTRSQPPFFPCMIDLVCKFKNNYNWGLKYLPQLEREYNFWCGDAEKNILSRHSVQLPDGNYLNRYFDSEKLPREESYLEDFKIAEGLPLDIKEKLYRDIRSAAESGWDFSSRWFSDEKNLLNCITSDILPVDLNCLLYFAEKLIAVLNQLNRNDARSKMFSRKADMRSELINKYCWEEKEKFYSDYNFALNKNTHIMTLAACYPLYFKIAEDRQALGVRDKVETYFLRDGGLLTTLNFTGQQWDAPNGWAPLQWIAIRGLRNYGFNNLADKIKRRWLFLNEKVFNHTGKMFEKYNVDDMSLHAGGGEYPLQDGFGWTNGIASALLSNMDEN